MISEQDLVHIARETMPFGKYQGRLIIDIPEEYLIWLKNKGFPEGKLGDWLALALEVKINSLESLVAPLRKESKTNKKKPKAQYKFNQD